MTITKKSKRLALEMRREQVIQLVSRGYTQRQIAQKIGCSPALVNNDIRYLRLKARDNIANYVNRILPEEMELSLVRLQQIIKRCFDDIENTETTVKQKQEAMIIIKDCSALRLEILGSGVLANELNNSSSSSKHASPPVIMNNDKVATTTSYSAGQPAISNNDNQTAQQEQHRPAEEQVTAQEQEEETEEQKEEASSQ